MYERDRIKAVQYGSGPIGLTVVRFASECPEIELVGAIDITNVGCELGEMAGLQKRLGVFISNDPDAVLSKSRPDIVFHNTSSSLKDVYPQIEKCIKAGANVISSTEELSYPFKKQFDLANAIDNLARQFQVTVLGTGVNPGYLMDSWPLFMTGICRSVDRIRINRIQDASERRISFQKKIGAGCTLEEFQKLARAGAVRHVGLEESIGMIADGLGWELERITEDLGPIVADAEVWSDFLTVKKGHAAGVKQVGHGFMKGEEVITLDFQAYIGAKESYDAVYITGIPDLEVTIKGGAQGDIATGAIIINSIHRVIEAPPGLMTMKDLPIITARRHVV